MEQLNHKKYFKMKNILTLIIAFFILSSCSDDFVEVTPPFAVNDETFFQGEEDYVNALIASYDILQSTYVNVMTSEIASDNVNAGGESPTDVIGWQQIDQMAHTPINQQLRDVWNYNFAGVQRAGFIIQNQDRADFEGKTQIIAEARLLRAYFNFQLVKFFGGIPIKPQGQFQLGEELTIPRSSVEDVYAYIEDDLLFAVENMDMASQDPYRFNRLAAHALLGKVYLYEEKFTEAAEQLSQVIDSGAFHLYGTQGEEDYEDLFEFIAENGPESVLEIQYTGVQGAGFDCLQCSEGNVMVGFSGVRGYNGPVFESGFGFVLPTEEMYNAFTPNDLRRDVSILDIEAWAAETGASFNVGNQDSETGHTGYYNRKYIPRINDNQPDVNLTQPNNYRAIRYADVLLMAAEALNRGGLDDELALDYVNQVRNRAGLSDVQANGSQLLDIIYNERKLELVGEGHRFFDLVRTGRASQSIEGFSTDKHEVFPIPLEEIQFSQGRWEQNQGY
ncbi:membrane protein [Psychroflexus planctonicus]|uniref:Membrane protein n=2 Tax=Psychroflexus planctonicus TaxID=1526575 RepID=A0ABQ1SJS7_9FLAO|nr:membrane protein [Psychroflexus planctonicus]